MTSDKLFRDTKLISLQNIKRHLWFFLNTFNSRTSSFTQCRITEIEHICEFHKFHYMKTEIFFNISVFINHWGNIFSPLMRKTKANMRFLPIFETKNVFRLRLIAILMK